MQKHANNYNEELDMRVRRLARRNIIKTSIFGWLVFYLLTLLSVIALLILVYPRMSDYSNSLSLAELPNVPVIKPNLPLIAKPQEKEDDITASVIYRQLESDNSNNLDLKLRPSVEEPIPLKNNIAEDNSQKNPETNNLVQNDTTISLIEDIVKKETENTQQTEVNNSQLFSLPKALQKGGWVVQLGSFNSQEQAEKAWLGIKDINQEISLYLKPYYSTLSIGDTQYVRLQSGYFAVKEESNQWCAWFVKQKQTCLSLAVKK